MSKAQMQTLKYLMDAKKCDTTKTETSGISKLNNHTLLFKNLTKPIWLLDISGDECVVLKLGQLDLENEGGEENVLTFKTILLSCLIQYSTFCLNEAFSMSSLVPWVAAKSRQCLTPFFSFLSLILNHSLKH